MAIDSIAVFQQKIEQAVNPGEKTSYALEIYRSLIGDAVRKETHESIELAAKLIYDYLSPMHSDMIVDNYNTWLSLSAIKNGSLDPSTVEEKLKIGIERNIFTNEELEEAKKSYLDIQKNTKKKPAGMTTTQLLKRI